MAELCALAREQNIGPKRKLNPAAVPRKHRSRHFGVFQTPPISEI
jgi:hypothetical protein